MDKTENAIIYQISEFEYREYTFYAYDGISFLNLGFENDVKMYGTQTELEQRLDHLRFENDVKKYGTQTKYKLNNTSITKAH